VSFGGVPDSLYAELAKARADCYARIERGERRLRWMLRGMFALLVLCTVLAVFA
jgi:hypothetical protein